MMTSNAMLVRQPVEATFRRRALESIAWIASRPRWTAEERMDKEDSVSYTIQSHEMMDIPVSL